MNDASHGRSAEADPSPESPHRPSYEPEPSAPDDPHDARANQRDRERSRQRDKYGPL